MERWSPRSSRSSTCATDRVVGYEALARPRDGSSPGGAVRRRARAEGRLSRGRPRVPRGGAARRRAAAGLGAPFALFLNADAGALELDLPDLPARRRRRW